MTLGENKSNKISVNHVVSHIEQVHKNKCRLDLLRHIYLTVES
jgi:hypothetical protein